MSALILVFCVVVCAITKIPIAGLLRKAGKNTNPYIYIRIWVF